MVDRLLLKFNPEIFKAYDIRGIYGRDFDEGFAFKLGMALVKYLQAKQLIVARDLRGSSLALADSFKDGIKSMGCDVLDLGPVTTPLFYFAIRKSGADGGAIITASHNPPEYNGFKIYRHKAMPVGSDSGLLDLQKILSGSVLERPKYAGKELADGGIITKYTDLIIQKSGLGPGTVNLAVKISAEDLVRKELEIIISTLGIHPVNDSHDVEFEFDFDGDRLAVLDSNVQKIRGDLVAGLLAGKLPSRFWSGPKLVHDSRFSRGVLNYLSAKGVKLIRSKVGHSFIKNMMRKHGADLGGELSGHLYFKEIGYVESAILAMLKIIKILNESNKNMGELVEPMTTWHNSGELNFQFPISPDSRSESRILDSTKWNRDNFQKIVTELKEKYKDGKIDELDGLTVEYDDWWFNLRPSNTEPVLRLVVEAKTQALLEKKIELEQALDK